MYPMGHMGVNFLMVAGGRRLGRLGGSRRGGCVVLALSFLFWAFIVVRWDLNAFLWSWGHYGPA